MISCGARLAPFDIPQLREVMAYDELELDRIGDRKTAVFFIISDTTQTYNFLVALAFSQMFNLLCERADNVHGGRLPHHVRVLWDEAANTGQVPQLEKLVAVIRSREVSLCLLYQQLAQCKAIYDTMNTILNGAKLPKIEALKKSRRELAGQKKELYAEYRDAQRQMREAVAIKANIDHLLGITDERENKAQER